MRLLLSLLVFLHTIHAALLDPISTTQPNTTYFPPKVHPQGPVRLNVPGGTPIPTSAWWSDLLLPQSNAIFTRIVSHPYQLRYRSNTNNGVAPYGIVASHTSSRMLSPFSNITTLSGIKKPRIQSYTSTADVGVGLSAVEHTTSGQSLEVIGFDLFSVTVRLFGAGGSYIQPLVHGMAYITAIYKNLTPFLFTQGCSITSVNGINANNTTTPLTFTSTRFRLTTSINTTWILYTYTPITMIWNTPTSLSGNVVYDGVIRVALSDGSEYMDTTLDAHADTYPTGASLFADVVAGVPLPPITPVTSTPTSTPIIGNSTVNTTETPSTPTSTPTSSPTSIPTRPTPLGLYVITWNVVGTGTLLHWALPHHVECIDPERTLLTNLTIQSSNKGMMTAFIGNKWNMNENGLTDYKWLPPRDADPTQIPALLKILNVELDVLSDILSMKNIMNTNTLTFGRKIYRAAQLLLVAETQFSNIAAYTPQISILRTALTLYLTRNITNKLGYDSTWLGIVSQVGYDDKNADGGNTYYHDHHQQYGYIIGAAAILAHFDPSWIPQYGSLIDTLIRDVANPSTSDVFFPQFRYFDWYNGHTYTRGLAISDAGRYLSSASEEIASHYAIYLWGMVTKRTDLQNLGNIMFGIARRTINRYMYMLSDSTIHPEFFVTNSVVAAYYDTKIDHYTLAPSALVLPAVNISAWQIRPVTPVTELIRYSDWTQQEWENVLGVAVGASTDVWSRSLALVSLSIFNTSASAQIQKLAGVGVDETLSISFTMYWAATRPPPGTITRPPVVIHAPPSGTLPPPSTTPSSTRESASWGWIIGTIIGIFVGIVLLVVVVIFCCIRREPGEAYTKKSSDGTTDL